MKVKVVLIIFVMLFVLFSGCSNPEKERENMIERTFKDAAILNEKSDFSGCVFLATAPEDAHHGTLGEYQLEGERGCYSYWNYNGRMYLTTIRLSSSSAHVFGIRVGDDISSIGEIMKKEGYKKGKAQLFTPVAPSRRNDSSPEWNIIPFSKNYITISLYVDAKTDDSKIIEIVITANDPQYAGIDY